VTLTNGFALADEVFLDHPINRAEGFEGSLLPG
jgi:acyl-CoA oxidase